MENRYSRQIAYFGRKVQEKIEKSSVCVIGCGALGSASAELLARAGFGKLKLIDRDFVEMSNLQRQRVFGEDDVDKPKASRLAEKLKKINSSIIIGHEIADFNPTNAENFIKGFDLVVDGLDNMFSRFVLNEACVKLNIPWIYGSAIRNVGYVSFIDPKKNCLRCFIKNPPSEIETCETSGITSPITTLISSMQVNEAFRYLARRAPLSGKLLYTDLETVITKTFGIGKDAECPVCAKRNFDLLEKNASNLTSLCGDNSYHISPPSGVELDLKGAKLRLPKGFGIKSSNEFLMRAVSGHKEITLFNDGRMITKNLLKKDAEKAFNRLVLV